ncbi:hypothetical protein KMZ29_20735 [Bradyrhizobium sediminis]|uniref:Uncharacterized protein n=1 Tax=Bradyrhizobium sediminis TaxID=2840469 RepID=A0A975NDE2_9BRAD|nr:hypothetical protein [Bradyrhizobium sediminis]QWG12124.1 hypothetical protein KMZ29_20735 [Bradyrhizobium sediminis]
MLAHFWPVTRNLTGPKINRILQRESYGSDVEAPVASWSRFVVARPGCKFIQVIQGSIK